MSNRWPGALPRVKAHVERQQGLQKKKKKATKLKPGDSCGG